MKSPSHLLSEHLREKVRGMPETSYGATRVIVHLDDGTSFRDVYIAWAEEVVKVGQQIEIPFDVSRVVDIEPQT